MHLNLPPVPFAALFNLPSWSIAIVVPIAGMVFGGVMAFMGMYFRHQRRQMWHELARIALEKGQPLPEFSDDARHPQRSKAKGDAARNDLRSGLILIGIGVGAYLFFGSVGAQEARFLGAIPGFIGVALLLHSLITALVPKKNSAPEDRPPQS